MSHPPCPTRRPAPGSIKAAVTRPSIATQVREAAADLEQRTLDHTARNEPGWTFSWSDADLHATRVSPRPPNRLPPGHPR